MSSVTAVAQIISARDGPSMTTAAAASACDVSVRKVDVFVYVLSPALLRVAAFICHMVPTKDAGDASLT